MVTDPEGQGNIRGFCGLCFVMILAGCGTGVHTDGHITNYVPDAWFQPYDRVSGYPDINSIPERSKLRPPSFGGEGSGRLELKQSQQKLNQRQMPAKREDNDPDWNG